jgi:hypothetical protein
MQISDEERKRRSQMARELHAQGKFGGRQPGSGRPKKKRASEIVAEQARVEAENIIEVFRDSIRSDNPASVRLNAAREWLKIEQSEADLQLREERQLEGLSTNQLVEMIMGRLTRVQEFGGVLPEELAGFLEGPDEETQVVEAESVEVEE